MISVNQLNFNYGSKKILNNIDFQADEGQVISLIGPNGSGKSTLLKCISSIFKVNKNIVFIQNKYLEDYSPKELSKLVTFLPQFQENFNNLSVYELIAMGRSTTWIYTKKDKQKIDWVIDYMKLDSIKYQGINFLSGGERQKVFIAMALVRDTPIIIMDEPLNHMDIKNQWEILDIIKDLKNNFNKTIIIVFHDINHALEVSDYIYMLKEGKVYAEGLCKEVITSENLKNVYNIETHIHEHRCSIKKCKKSVVIPIGVNLN